MFYANIQINKHTHTQNTTKAGLETYKKDTKGRDRDRWEMIFLKKKELIEACRLFQLQYHTLKVMQLKVIILKAKIKGGLLI